MAEGDVVIEEHDSTAENLAVGSVVPDFTLFCEDGKEHKLSDFRGSKVLLCFYRYSYCPNCAYSVGKLIGSYKKLAWAAKLKVITVFQTDQEWLQKGLTNSNAPLANLLDEGCYPFLALADPAGEAASTFKVEVLNKCSLSFGLKCISDNITTSKMHGVRIGNNLHLDPWMEMKTNAQNGLRSAQTLPSEFLINEDGMLIDEMRTKYLLESMDFKRIEHFLLRGERLSPGEP